MRITRHKPVSSCVLLGVSLLSGAQLLQTAAAAVVEGDIATGKPALTATEAMPDVVDDSTSSPREANTQSVPKPRVDPRKPSVARVPDTRNKPSLPSEQEARLAELKHGLSGPGGLIYLSDLQEFVENWPENSQARMWLIRALIQSGDAGAALNAIGAPGQWREPDWQVGFWKANAHLLGGELALALAESEHALNQENRSPDIWVQRAVLEQQAGNHGGAVQLLTIALKLDPDHAMAQLNLGYSLEHLSRPVDALKAYRHFITTSAQPGSALRQQVLERIQLLSDATHPAAYTVTPVKPSALVRHDQQTLSR